MENPTKDSVTLEILKEPVNIQYFSINMWEYSTIIAKNVDNKIKLVIWYGNNLQERNSKKEVEYFNYFFTETILQ